MTNINKNKELFELGRILAVELYNNRLDLSVDEIQDQVAAGILAHYIEKVTNSQTKLGRLLGHPVSNINRLAEKFDLPVARMPTKFQPESQPEIEIAQEYERPKPHIKSFGQVKLEDDVKF